MKGIIIFISLITLLMIGGSVQATSNVVEVSKTVNVNTDDSISTIIILSNNGDTTAEPFLVEIQPRFGTCISQGLAWTSSQSVCDHRYPNNIHRFVYDLASGETVTVDLTTSPMPDGTYCVVGVSVDSCCPDNPNCQATQPYGWQTILGEVNVESDIPQECGDGECTGNENPGNCPQDCDGYCGDNYCQPNIGETSQNCPSDCDDNPSQTVIDWIMENPYIIIALIFVVIGVILIFRKGGK